MHQKGQELMMKNTLCSQPSASMFAGKEQIFLANIKRIFGTELALMDVNRAVPLRPVTLSDDFTTLQFSSYDNIEHTLAKPVSAKAA